MYIDNKNLHNELGHQSETTIRSRAASMGIKVGGRLNPVKFEKQSFKSSKRL